MQYMKTRLKYIAQQAGRNALAVTCGILIVVAIEACGGIPLVKWWFLDGRDAQALVRKECNKDGGDCKLIESKSFQEADGFFCASPNDWEARELYVKALERKVRDCR